ncbi:MAG: phospho-N-acetylmuramoyl-pentapeptide-transferase [Clostridium sp.]|nr:phospho-N-acetylmuramoyl-pentapeptide-transferase [Clostridium sp.]MCI7444095.1 phospho-N-acetylmuramoyl-pentapeptide-transferase [Clostridium sp.]
MGSLEGFFNSKIIIAFVLSLGVSLLLGPLIIPMLHKLKFGQNIREEGPKNHLKKAGTPTIGGLIFITSTIVSMIIMRYKLSDEAMVVMYGMLAFGLIGFLDDMLKIIHKHNEGLTSKQKFLLQLLFSVIAAWYGYTSIGTEISIPFTNIQVNLGWIFIPFVMFYFVALTNAVNLTDGLDGLNTSVTIIVMIFFAIVSFGTGHKSVAVFSVALIGGLIGFLKYNRYPAKVFMGDTGSIALGGAISTILLVLKNPLVIIIVGGIYVLETVSVIIQVTYYKKTKKRFFKMAPIHHHFEQLGWSEVKIVAVFSAITAILCLVGFISL